MSHFLLKSEPSCFSIDDLQKNAKIRGLDLMSAIGYVDNMLNGYFTFDGVQLNQEAITSKNTGTFSISFPIALRADI